MENLNLFTNIESSSKDSSKTSTTPSTDVKKEGMSLFDSLMKESAVTIAKEETATANTNSKQQVSTKEVSKDLLSSENKIEILNAKEVNQSTPNFQSKANDTLISSTSTKDEVILDESTGLIQNATTKNNSVQSTLNSTSLNKLVVDSKTNTNVDFKNQLPRVGKSIIIENLIIPSNNSKDLLKSENKTEILNAKEVNQSTPNFQSKANDTLISSTSTKDEVILDESTGLIQNATTKNNSVQSTLNSTSLNKLVVDSKTNTNVDFKNQFVNNSNVTSNSNKQNDTVVVNQNVLNMVSSTTVDTEVLTTNLKQNIESNSQNVIEETDVLISKNLKVNEVEESVDSEISNNAKNQLVKEILTTAKDSKTNSLETDSKTNNELKSENGMKVGITLNNIDKNTVPLNQNNLETSLVVDSKNNISVSNETKENIVKTQNIVLNNESSSNDGLSLMDKLLNDAKVQIDLKNKSEVKEVSNKNVNVTISKETMLNNSETNENQTITLPESNEQTLVIDDSVEETIINSNKISKLEPENKKQEVQVDVSKKENVDLKTNDLKQNITQTEILKPILNQQEVKVKTESSNDTNETEQLELNDEVIKDVLTKNYESLKNDTQVNIDNNSDENKATVTKLNNTIEIETKSNQIVQNNSKLENASNLNSQNMVEINNELNNNSKSLDGITQDAVVKEDNKIKSSLLDDLIKKATAQIQTENKAEVKGEIKTELKIDSLNTLNILNKEQPQKTEVLGNIFLGLQKNSVTNQNIINTSIARAVLTNASGINDVKKASDILNLNAQDIQLKIENNELLKDVDVVKLDRKISILDKLMTNIQKIEDTNILSSKLIDAAKVDSTGVTSTNNTVVEAEDVTINVNQTLANNIQTRIIGARQQMSSMMSDLARTMYENYKPPVTTFKINLNPANLGMISVVMKNERDSSISISMNMSNNATLEAMIDNQNSLRGALFRAFGNDDSAFNLDFGSNNNSSDQNQDNNEFASSVSTSSETNSSTTINSEQEDNLTYL